MLQTTFEITEHLYNPINHLTQNELMEKFNLAFYEGQNLSKADILSTFKDEIEETSTQENSSIVNDDVNETNDDYLIDYLLSNSPVSTPSSDVDITFDFNDFVSDFDENFSKNESQTGNDENFDTETYTTESSVEENNQNVLFPFFIPPPINCKMEKLPLENFQLKEININEDLIDFEDLSQNFQDIHQSISKTHEEQEGYQTNLPPIETINKNSMEFNNFLRTAPADNISFYNQVCYSYTLII